MHYKYLFDCLGLSKCSNKTVWVNEMSTTKHDIQYMEY